MGLWDGSGISYHMQTICTSLQTDNHNNTSSLNFYRSIFWRQQTVSKHWRQSLTHTHTCLMALFPGLPGWASTRKVKPVGILLKQETVSGSGISWAICKSAPRSRQINTPAPHHSVFLQAGCPSCRPTNSVRALKTVTHTNKHAITQQRSNRLPFLQ